MLLAAIVGCSSVPGEAMRKTPTDTHRAAATLRARSNGRGPDALHAAIATGATTSQTEYLEAIARPAATAASRTSSSRCLCALVDAAAHMTAAAVNCVVMPSGAIQRK